ncbi:T9SS type A sorting domain-containing protein [bacterium]|nr:T9SS type A sorting domain-containing protein [bacterium]
MRSTSRVALLFLLLLFPLLVFPAVDQLLAATISINPTQTLGQVNQLIFGNAQPFGHGDLLLEMDDSSWSFNPQALDLVSDLSPTILRFIGADIYFWEDGIGPHHLRPSPRHGQVKYFGFDYGIDEHMALCEQIGAEAFITVNYGSGIVGDSLSTAAPLSQRVSRAADWVEYCNAPNDGSNPNGGIDWASRRAGNGHPEPYGVKFWELGNEIYGFWTPGYVDVETYAQEVPAFCWAMKAVDPDIKIGAVGTILPHWCQWWYQDAPEWNSNLLPLIHQYIDFYVVHCYYPGHTTVSGEELYRASLAGPNQALIDIREVRRIIDQTDSSIAIVPGENGFWAGTDQYQYQLTTSLLAGLHYADLLILFLEQSTDLNIPFTCGWLLHSTDLNANIVYKESPERRFARPKYYAQQIFREHFGDVLVTHTVDCGTFSTTEVQWVQAMSDVPELSVCTSIDSAGTNLYIMVINKQLDENVEATIQVVGFEVQPEAHIWTLNGPSITASNEEDPNTVNIVPSALSSVSSSFTYTFPAHSLTAIELRRSEESTPPVISDVTINDVTGFSALASWQTDKPADSRVKYGTAPGDYPWAVEDPTLTIQHQALLEALQSETQYYLRVVSCDAQGNETIYQEATFWTPDVTPPLISQVEVVAITETTATICWLTDEPADSRVECWYADGSFPTLLGTTFTEEHLIGLSDLQSATTYSCQVSSADTAGNCCVPQEGSFTTSSPRSGAYEWNSSDQMPGDFKLWQNFPNPFNGSTNIRYQLPQRAFVLIKVYNSLGQLVKTLMEENQPPGDYQVSWDARDGWGEGVASGVYFCFLQAGDFRESCKMTLLK